MKNNHSLKTARNSILILALAAFALPAFAQQPPAFAGDTDSSLISRNAHVTVTAALAAALPMAHRGAHLSDQSRERTKQYDRG